MKEISGWLGLLAGLLLGATIGGLVVYALLSKEAKTMVKTFAYDEAGRLIQVMKQEGV